MWAHPKTRDPECRRQDSGRVMGNNSKHDTVGSVSQHHPQTTEAPPMPVGTCQAPVSWFSRASMDEEASLGAAWRMERQRNTEQSGSPCSGWAYWSCHILGEPRAPAIQDTPAPTAALPPRPLSTATSDGTHGAEPQRRLLCMDGAAFWVMKYSQVSDSLRNDGDQSIPFQGVIFFPFTASVSC